MCQGKENRIRQVDTAGLFVDGGCNDVRIHRNGAVPAGKLAAQFDGGIFSTEEPAQTFVNYENQLCQPCVKESSRYINLGKKIMLN